MAWETGNELVAAPSNWTTYIASFLKDEVQVKQLVMDGRNMRWQGQDPNWPKMSKIDLVTSHYYPPNATVMLHQSRQAHEDGKIFTVGEYGWEQGDLGSFLQAIETLQNVSGDCFWSLFPHGDEFGFVNHGTSHTLHYPGQTPDMISRSKLLREHAFKMRGVPVPQPKPPPAPLITILNATHLAWRGSVGAANYSVAKSSCQNCPLEIVGSGLTDLDTPLPYVHDPRAPYVAVRAFAINNKAGAWSPLKRATEAGLP